MIDLHCEKCGKYMATLRDARVRDGMVVYCHECDQQMRRTNKPKPQTHDMPDVLKDIFGMRG